MSSPRNSGLITRFAPSPTGYLHLGHAYAAWMASQAAATDGFVLRIEDLDRGRCRPEFTQAIFDDLHWLGLRWREPVLHQSTRSTAYGEAFAQLRRRSLVYPCFCTRAAIAADIALAGEAPHPTGDVPPLYPGTCRRLSDEERQRRIGQGEPHAWRLDVASAAGQSEARELYFIELGERHTEPKRIAVQAQRFGDIVLARKDLPAAYHLAVVLDDAAQGITLVTRGEDLQPATHVQRLLQALLGLAVPRYAHHRLILDADGRKFSKRDQSQTLRSLRAEGTTPQQLQRRLGNFAQADH